MSPDIRGDVRRGSRELFWDLHNQSSYTCPGCGAGRDETTAMHVHHVDGNRTNHTRGNLVALCNQCHLGGEHGLDIDNPQLSPPSVSAPRPSVSAPRPGP